MAGSRTHFRTSKDGEGRDRFFVEHSEVDRDTYIRRHVQVHGHIPPEMVEKPAVDAAGLRTDGPTFEEYVAAGYPGERYPPFGYAEKPSAGLDAFKANGAAAAAEAPAPSTTDGEGQPADQVVPAAEASGDDHRAGDGSDEQT